MGPWIHKYENCIIVQNDSEECISSIWRPPWIHKYENCIVVQNDYYKTIGILAVKETHIDEKPFNCNQWKKKLLEQKELYILMEIILLPKKYNISLS